MQIERNPYDNISVRSFILCKANGDRLGSIKCAEKKSTQKFIDCNEISFTTYLYNDTIKNDLYDTICELQYIEVPEEGRFIISSVQIQSEGTEYENKQCVAISEEVILAQKYLENFTINMGSTESIDGVSLYNLSDPHKSLLHLALEKYPDWTIGHVDTELYTMQRCFEITKQDVYSFFTSTVSKAFQCVFIFDTLNHRINVYKESSVGEDTNIYISYNNLLKNTNISSSTDDIKTCLTVLGADELNLREVNIGYDKIYNLEYFHDLKYMSSGLYEAYENWKKKWNTNVKAYEDLITQYQGYYNQIHFLEHEKMPSSSESTNWSEYGLIPLKEQLSSYENKQSIMIKAGQGAPGHKDYTSLYLPCFNSIQTITSQIKIIEKQIADLKKQQKSVETQMNNIISSVSMENNFTAQQRKELSKFIREDELSSSNFVVTDTMTDSERMDMLHEMLDYAQEELAKVSQPTLQFDCDMGNIYLIPEFNIVSQKFEVGNYIHICLRDDFKIKARILSIERNLYDESDFKVTFGNIMKLKTSDVFQNVTDALKIASSTATSVSFNSSNWNRGNKEATDISKMLADGLLAAGQSLHSAQSDIVVDDRGMIIRNKQNTSHAGDTIFFGGGQILFSDDNLKTIKTALGRVQYTKKGITYNDFGLLAQFVMAGYIAGSIIEGTEFINGNGTFSVTPQGYLTSKSGNIAGWEITKNAIFNNLSFTNQKNSKSTGMGTYGSNWAFWAGNGKFSVDQDGKIVAESGKIGGAEISDSYIKATNGKWQLNSLTGYATFTGAKINGVDIGSTFGGLTYNGNGTHGNFNNGFTADRSFGVTGGALNNFNSLVANKVTAAYIDATVKLSANYATIQSLEAAKARISTIESNYISANTVAANYATISSLDAAKARIDSLETNVANIQNLYVKTADINNLIANNATIKDLKTASIDINRLLVNGRPATWTRRDVITDVKAKTVTVAGVEIHEIGSISHSSIYCLS